MSSTFFNTPIHQGLDFAGQLLEWLPTDTEANYKKNLQNPEFAAIAQEHGWTQYQPITYNINSCGFRGKEFDAAVKNIVTLGCSFTIGIGLREQETWPCLLGSRLGLHVHNIAWGGWSADTLFRMAQYWIPKLNPDIVVVLIPNAARIELVIGNEQYKDIIPSDSATHDNYLQNWFTNQQNHKLNRLKNTLAIEMICKRAGIKFMCYPQDTEKFGGRLLTNPKNVARDNLHCGAESHVNFVEKILKDMHG